MSATVTLHCDRDGCAESFRCSPPERLDVTRYEATLEGWTAPGGFVYEDMCPRHAPGSRV